MGKTIKELMKDIPLETRLKVSNEMAFINLIVELGYREDKAWTDDEDELLGKLMTLADEHTKSQMKYIEENNKRT